MAKIEKLCRPSYARKHRSGWCRWLKRQLARARRRAEKRDPENAGTRIRDFTSGWSD